MKSDTKQSKKHLKLVPKKPPLRPPIEADAEIHKRVNQSIAALGRDSKIYQRGGRLVTLVRVAQAEADDGAPEGTPQIRDLARATLRERLSRRAFYFRYGESGDRYQVVPPNHVVDAVRERGAWPGIRSLVAVTETPTLRPNGTVVQSAGYDRATRLLYLPSTAYPTIPEEPTQRDAAVAYGELTDAFVDFPYVDDSHRSAAIAAIPTLVARSAIEGAVPGFVFDAAVRGSGKTLQTDLISIVATGRGMPRMTFPAEVIELEKVLGAYGLQGARLICFDNVTRRFGGGPLDKVLTARDVVELRVLGRTEVPIVPWRAVIFATGNNIQFDDDTRRRVLVPRLEPQCEHPELRAKFTHGDAGKLLAWALKNRARLVVASLTIVRAYIVAGRPDMGCAPWGSFEGWSGLIPPAIVFAGGADPMKARPSTDASSMPPELAAFARMLQRFERIHRRVDRNANGITAKQLIAAVFTTSPRRTKDDEIRDAIETIAGSSRDATRLGKAFARHKGRVFGGKKAVIAGSHAGTMRWAVVEVAGEVPGGVAPSNPTQRQKKKPKNSMLQAAGWGQEGSSTTVRAKR